MLQCDMYDVKIGLLETTDLIACFKTYIAGRNWNHLLRAVRYKNCVTCVDCFCHIYKCLNPGSFNRLGPHEWIGMRRKEKCTEFGLMIILKKKLVFKNEK